MIALNRPQSADLGRKIVPVTAVGVVLAFALLLMPVSERDYTEIAIAAVCGVGLIALSFGWHRMPRVIELGVPLGYLLVVGVLRDAAGGGSSGFGGLYLLPIIYLALYAPRIELFIGLGAMAAANIVPLLLIGKPEYPTTTWRGTLVQVAAAAVAGLTIQQLVLAARANAAELATQNTRLRELDRMKDEFVYLITHDLRTPLTSVIGYLELLVEEPLNATQREYAAMIEANAERLHGLVNNLLFVARIEGGSMLELNRGPVDLGAVIRQSVDSIKPAADRKTIGIEIDAREVPVLEGDADKLAQLVDNLLGNAVKFTPIGGQVKVAAAGNNGNAVLTVADTGIGIPKDEQHHLFERFFRSSNAGNASTPGTGLGLTIVKSIAEAHGGVVSFESDTSGTTFRVELPIR